jgi:predicted nuclease of predicted toxin-antitoxin system
VIGARHGQPAEAQLEGARSPVACARKGRLDKHGHDLLNTCAELIRSFEQEIREGSMPWKRIENPDREERRALDRDFGGKIRFLVDESLDPTLTIVLDELGWKAESAANAGLSGKSDEDVFGYAWRKKQFLLTSDKDFLDDRRFPPHRNPGVIILPNAPIDSDSLTTALRQALYTIAPLGRLYRGSKIVITAEGEISITDRNNETGAIEKQRFRLDAQGNTFLWEDEPA